MELTKCHLKQLQRELNKSIEGGSIPKLSDARIDILLVHEDQIPVVDDSHILDGEIDLESQEEKQNSSIVNFEDGDCINYETILLDVDKTLLENVEVHVKDDTNGLSRIFDPENTSLLYQKKSENKKSAETNVLKELDSNVGKPSTKPNPKSKIPLPENKIVHQKPMKRIKKSSSMPKQVMLPAQHNSKLVTRADTKSQIDLKFPRLDHLIQKLAEQRSL